MPLNVVNLFAGHGTWARPWFLRGHWVWSTDIEPKFKCDLTVDILDLRLRDIPWGPGEVDVLLASPDCTAFSVASIGTHWAGGPKGYIPKTDKARNRMALVHKTVAIIEALRPRAAVIENPRGMLRKLGILDRYQRETVWYCHYGDSRGKPTDLWGAPFPPGWLPRPPCHNRRPNHGPGCCCHDHEAASRGAKTGTQGLEKEERSFMPYDLAESVCIATESLL